MLSTSASAVVRTLLIAAAGVRTAELVSAVRDCRDLLLLEVAPADPRAPAVARALGPDLVILCFNHDVPMAPSVLEDLARVSQAPVLCASDPAAAAVAFDVGALDFWLTGRERASVSRTVGCIRAQQHAAREARIGRRVIEAVKRRDAQGGRRRIALRSEGMMVMVDPLTIQHIEAVGNYVRLVHSGGSTVVRCTLEALTERLGPSFIRVHRSHVVPIERVRALRISRNRREVLLTDVMAVPLGRRYAALAEQRLAMNP